MDTEPENLWNSLCIRKLHCCADNSKTEQNEQVPMAKLLDVNWRRCWREHTHKHCFFFLFIHVKLFLFYFNFVNRRYFYTNTINGIVEKRKKEKTKRKKRKKIVEKKLVFFEMSTDERSMMLFLFQSYVLLFTSKENLIFDVITVESSVYFIVDLSLFVKFGVDNSARSYANCAWNLFSIYRK